MEPKPVLLKLLQEQDPARHAAAEALMLLGDPGLPAITEMLADPDWLVRGVAAESLGENNSSVAVPNLLAALGDPQPEVRRAAAWALSKIGQQALIAPMVVPGLFEVLYSEDPAVREAAIMALGPIKHADVPNALLWALGDPDQGVREAAADALGNLGRETIDVLVGALNHEHPGVRAAITMALVKIARHYSKADLATPALIERLRDYDPEVRRIAAEALGQIEDPDATAALCERLWDEVPEVRKISAWALGQIEDPEALPTLLEALADPAIEVQEAVVEALGKLEEMDAVPSLLRMLGHPKKSVRRACARALGQIGVKHHDKSRETLVALVHALGDPDPVTRRMAVRAIGEIGEKIGGKHFDAEIGTELVRMLTDPDVEVRKNAASAIGNIGIPEAVRALADLLRAPSEVQVEDPEINRDLY